MEEVFMQTPLGMTAIKGDEDGIVAVSVSKEDAVKPSQHIPASLVDAVKQLEAYFAGTRQTFQLRLNPKGTDFQKSVWQELLNIPYGKTISYLELSRRLGDVKAIRAVAAANGQNPFWIVVPCHRVIGSDGSLTGYAGGLWRKKWLLDHENPYKQQTLF
ncbi:methylated-DNA--[protein]-cysteine S-methyltransferase [Parapedobacter sp. 2B3]|uniref:methylated-DNA--[protein]-cysteine S-methyltransferase n=1 Tax=Parapedobacter sp. 2B3 TaxID=3342381 RepID=UPI0035B61295